HGNPENVFPDEATQTGQYRRLSSGGASVQSPVWRIPPATDRFWWVRIRGDATVKLETHKNEATIAAQEIAIQSSEWQWIRHDIPQTEDFGPVQLSLTILSGTIDADYGLLTMGHWPGMEQETQQWTLLAADFFRAGVSETETHSVSLRPAYEVQGRIFYGPRLPLAAGLYDITLHTSSSAPEGTLLGEWQITGRGHSAPDRQEVRAGQASRIRWHQTHTLPVEVDFSYNRAAETTLQKVVFERILNTEGGTL
ncbi:MAG: hypothetical protein ACNA71_07885, partial [Kiritimatiellia bacterium]